MASVRRRLAALASLLAFVRQLVAEREHAGRRADVERAWAAAVEWAMDELTSTPKENA